MSVMFDRADVLSANTRHKHPPLREHQRLQPSAKPPAGLRLGSNIFASNACF